MLQRIQSIFLLLAGGASLGLFGVPFATTPKAIEGSTIFADAAYSIQDQLALMILFALAGAIAIISIFLFKNRGLQMRLSIFAFIANLIGVIFGVIFFMQNSSDTGTQTINDGFGIYFPIAAMIFALLAYRFINKDNKLVKSMDRLR
jgi:glucan phosphoethanolaminetransferase (alkaline phosphatase superfamily)